MFALKALENYIAENNNGEKATDIKVTKASR